LRLERREARDLGDGRDEALHADDDGIQHAPDPRRYAPRDGDDGPECGGDGAPDQCDPLGQPRHAFPDRRTDPRGNPHGGTNDRIEAAPDDVKRSRERLHSVGQGVPYEDEQPVRPSAPDPMDRSDDDRTKDPASHLSGATDDPTDRARPRRILAHPRAISRRSAGELLADALTASRISPRSSMRNTRSHPAIRTIAGSTDLQRGSDGATEGTDDPAD
jgi:hypothetical protein